MKLKYSGRTGRIHQFGLELQDGDVVDVTEEQAAELLTMSEFKKVKDKPKTKPKEEEKDAEER
jgi:hypothetical protein